MININYCSWKVNDSDLPMIDEDGSFPAIPPRHVRYYEMFHVYQDVTIEQHQQHRQEVESDPAYQILVEEIQKEINKQVIADITSTARGDQ